MGDLYLGLAIILFVSTLLAWAGNAASQRISYALQIIVIAAIAVMVAYLRRDSNHLWLAGILPFSNLIVLGNPTLPAVALVSGMAFGRMRSPPARRCVILGLLVLVAMYDLVHPLIGKPPELAQMWTKGVCRQTSSESCSAAAAATLLHAKGIESSEREMAELCLTRSAGTSAAGIYRGLKLKTAGHGLRVRAFHTDIAGLRELARNTPVLLSVELRTGEHVDPRYERDWGWTPGVSHSIVLFRFLPNDRLEVGDPDVGRETWNIESLRVLWHGNGLLVEADGLANQR